MSKLIYFVDDDKMILNLLEYTLKNRQDYEIRTFSDGKHCLESLDENPDLVVLDLELKNNGSVTMSGLDILKEIKKVRLDIPVVILSSNENESTREQLLNSGANKYIVKNDFFIDEVMDLIDDSL